MSGYSDLVRDHFQNPRNVGAIAEAETLTKEDYASALGALPASKMHCSVLAADTVRAAAADYPQRTPH